MPVKKARKKPKPAPILLRRLRGHFQTDPAELPVLEVVSGMHILADLTLDLGQVVHDYLA